MREPWIWVFGHAQNRCSHGVMGLYGELARTLGCCCGQASLPFIRLDVQTPQALLFVNAQTSIESHGALVALTGDELNWGLCPGSRSGSSAIGRVR